MASSTNHCGRCSLCCRLLGIDALEKMPNVWCKFCKPGRGGCQIHNQPEFPEECADYVCLWLQSHHEGAPFADDLRPDRCQVVIDKRLGENIHNVRCNIGYPHAWKDPRVEGLADIGGHRGIDRRAGHRVGRGAGALFSASDHSRGSSAASKISESNFR